MGSSMDSKYYTCPGCFKVFDYGYSHEQFEKANNEIDRHQETCVLFKQELKRDVKAWKQIRKDRC